MNHGVEFRNVSKRYGNDASAPLAVDSISFEVPKGSLTTILGPSGCGKTTTLRMIAGLESPSGGQILMDGKDVTTLGPAERNVSMMFQSYALFPHMNVLDNVQYGLKMSGVSKTASRQRALDSLGNVGLHAYQDRLPSELSGGQQQRVALARALVLEPAVLLFDEPLSNLDARLRREMREEIRTLQQRLQLTVAYVTHDQSEALAVSDQIVVMNEGKIAQRGTPQDMYERPRSEFVAGFMGEAMLFPAARNTQGQVMLGPLPIADKSPRIELESKLGGALKVAVRPEAWKVHRAREGQQQCISASLLKTAYLGSFYEYTFDTPLGKIFVVSPDLENVLRIGDEVNLSLADHGVSVIHVAA